MQKHNEWLSNQGYVKHLEILRRIKDRRSKQNLNPLVSPHKRKLRPDCKTRDQTIRRKTQINIMKNANYSNAQRFISEDNEYELIGNDSQQCHQQDESRRSDTYHREIRIKDKEFVMSAIPAVMPVSIREQKIIWDNYHLGKRIIETPPVISKRKLDHEYRKHCKLVRGMTTNCTNRKPATLQFRLKKLQEFKVEVEQIADERRIIQTGRKRNLLTIRIDEIRMSRVHRLTVEEVVIAVKFDGEKGGELSQLVGYDQLPYYHFFFPIPKKHIKNRTPIILEIRQVKGLQHKNIGFCTFRFAEMELIFEKMTVHLFHCGKAVGDVILSAAVGKKKEFVRGDSSPKTTERKQQLEKID